MDETPMININQDDTLDLNKTLHMHNLYLESSHFEALAPTPPNEPTLHKFTFKN